MPDIDELDRAAAMIDYIAECRADPAGEWLTFAEYLPVWIESREWEQQRAIDAECWDEAAMERQAMRAELARVLPCYDDSETPF